MQRTIIDDLNNVEIVTDELIVKPETKNIHLLNSKKVEHLNIYSFNQKQFEKAVEYFNVSSLSFYEFKVEDLSPIKLGQSREPIAYLEYKSISIVEYGKE